MLKSDSQHMHKVPRLPAIAVYPRYSPALAWEKNIGIATAYTEFGSWQDRNSKTCATCDRNIHFLYRRIESDIWQCPFYSYFQYYDFVFVLVRDYTNWGGTKHLRPSKARLRLNISFSKCKK